MAGMSDRKTQPTGTSVEEVIDRVGDERRRDDAREVLDLMQEVTGVEPVVWGPSMIGTELVDRAWQDNHQPG